MLRRMAVSTHRSPGLLVRLLAFGLIGLSCVLPARAQLLVWSMGNSPSQTQGVAAWLQASGQFSSVTAVESTTLTLPDLANYQQVLFFSNSNSGSDPAVGNVLADYADTGRRLVVATFAWANQGANTLGGRFITGQISPFVIEGSTLYSPATLGQVVDPTLFSGVATLSGYFRDFVGLSSGAHALAYWSDGTPLLAVKGNVVAISLFPDDAHGSISGDYRQLFINSLTLQAIPEPSTWALLALGLGGALLRWRRRGA
jgi:hypothetical protein